MIRNGWKPAARDLMEFHVQALFTHDRNMRLRTVNEPWPGDTPAPRFFLGRTVEGTALCRIRHDVPEETIDRLQTLCADEPPMTDAPGKPRHFDAYMHLLGGERFTMGPCFLMSSETVPPLQVVRVDRKALSKLSFDGFEWLLPEIEYAQPCIALALERRIVAICRSVRITPLAHEAGVETLEPFRGRGYASAVAAGWANAVRELGCLPLYSTSWDNLASRRIAKKLAMTCYGATFSVH